MAECWLTKESWLEVRWLYVVSFYCSGCPIWWLFVISHLCLLLSQIYLSCPCLIQNYQENKRKNKKIRLELHRLENCSSLMIYNLWYPMYGFINVHIRSHILKLWGFISSINPSALNLSIMFWSVHDYCHDPVWASYTWGGCRLRAPGSSVMSMFGSKCRLG